MPTSASTMSPLCMVMGMLVTGLIIARRFFLSTMYSPMRAARMIPSSSNVPSPGNSSSDDEIWSPGIIIFVFVI